MHIVFIVGSYYPYYSAVGKCVGNVAEELSKSHQVTVICEKSHTSQVDEEIYNGQRIIRIITKEKKTRDKLDLKIQESKGNMKKIHSSILILYKVTRASKIVFSSVSFKYELVKQFIKAISSIDDPIEVIIPSSMPFESVFAATKYKNDSGRKVKIIPYLFDQFVDSATLHRLDLNRKFKRKRHINLEQKIFAESYSILAMHSLYTHFTVDLPNVVNICYIEHPLVSKYNTGRLMTNMKGIKISYIGGLYKNYVEPDYLLFLFTRVRLNQAVLHFYVVGNCFDTVNKYSSETPEKIINHGNVDKQTANQEILNSNILISIAEKKGIQLSSKIFEYMSSGRPIIHFYSIDNDVNLKVLERYPLALCLKQDITLLDENIEKFERFCKESCNCQIPFEEVEKLFIDATPQYTAELIEELIMKNENEGRS